MTSQTPPPGCPAHQPQHAGFPLYSEEFATDPADVYARLRATYGPLAPVELYPGATATLALSYQAALEVLRSPETFSKDSRRWKGLADGRVSPDNPTVPMMAYRPNCLFSDGDAHDRLRGAVTDSLDRVDPNALRGYIERGADRLIDHFAARGEADLVGEYARALPLLVFNELFGSPAHFGDRLVAGMSGIFDGVDAERANAELTATLLELVALKRASPGADVTSWLMAHPAALNDEEMLHHLVLLMGAGTEPQLNLISNTLRLLLSDDRFGGDLAGGSLPIEDALDEVLWTDPPMANYAVHFPVRDVDLAGVRLPEGEPVVVSFAAANTDPALAGVSRTGNRAHLAWSAGPHACPAQGPARLIASVAVERLLDRLPDLELAVKPDELVWRPGPFHRALAALPVRFPPATVTTALATPLATNATTNGPTSTTGSTSTAEATAAATAGPHPAVAAADSTALASDPASGGTPWSPTAAPSGSTLPVATSTPRPGGSTRTGRWPRWSSLVAWLRGR
ncbi:cytochrome P450 [Kitasatospora sp. GAS204A]|uniref:cytochrome P450 n=1 Tax=unclassified Kitasatospora TaxID=2633591 RepID=UPI002475DC4C|nr:cytochrome P450 [Kitasatospora sp. GAS204B]MDH6118331.1 cytochrome P450 [Kitasatospora sp. GAS204B]